MYKSRTAYSRSLSRYLNHDKEPSEVTWVMSSGLDISTFTFGLSLKNLLIAGVLSGSLPHQAITTSCASPYSTVPANLIVKNHL